MSPWEEIGARLKDARRRAGISQAEAARLLGVTRAYVSMMEAGRRSIDSITLARLADFYGIPLTDVLGGTIREDPVQLLLRATQLREPARHAIRRFGLFCAEYGRLERAVLGRVRAELPVYDAAQWGGDPAEQGEALAAQERRRLGLGEVPVPDMLQLLDSQGIKVRAVALDDDEFAGCFLWSSEFGPGILVNVSQRTPVQASHRWNFTAAHEYAHALVDRHRGGVVDTERTLQGYDAAERRANAFAAAFLMPPAAVQGILRSLGWEEGHPLGPAHVVHLQQHFGVSYRAMLLRLRDLGLVDARRLDVLSEVRPLAVARALGYDPDGAAARARRLIAPPMGFLHLAARAYGEGRISLGKFAEFAELDRAGARGVLEELGVEVEAGPGAEDAWTDAEALSGRARRDVDG